MAYIKITCPSCGATVEPAGDNDFFCQYCGTKIVRDKQFIELSGAVSVNGIAGENSLLDRAFLFLEDGDFVEADKYLEKVLDINPRCAKAYIGKLLCQTGLKKLSDLTSLRLPLKNYDYFNKALRFSSAEEARYYNSLSDAVSATIDSAKAEKENNIDKIKSTIYADSAYLETHKKDYQKCIIQKVIWLISMILSIALTAMFLIGTIAAPPIAIILVPCAALMIIIIKKYIAAKKSTQEYDGIKAVLPQKQAFLQSRQAEYLRWVQNKQQLVPAVKGAIAQLTNTVVLTPSENLFISRGNAISRVEGKINLILDGKLYGVIPGSGSMALRLTEGNHKIQFTRAVIKSKVVDIFIGAEDSRINVIYTPDVFQIPITLKY